MGQCRILAATDDGQSAGAVRDVGGGWAVVEAGAIGGQGRRPDHTISANTFGGLVWERYPAGIARLCNSLFEPYAYTRDSAYLQKVYDTVFAGAGIDVT
ncbi:hypothetical protein OG689_03565 [Kitasatospora sp. NBC_00240]|uniref:hypothetical protein n=1 Tax=Kitasatospora sp. NBC_00240 TaxID=2903567 RepID=UPI002259CC17|nr:hypothetical protein [Kitasatospora sp. NBC_00240]MCX5208385.1 hypothetical protein [Kitasatospora sp. NBC_00240]